MGGLGHSDLTTRTCVYPSYNIQDDKAKTAVLLNSYTWQQDWQRLASLISTNADPAQKAKDEADLKELLFRELVRLHQNKDMPMRSSTTSSAATTSTTLPSTGARTRPQRVRSHFSDHSSSAACGTR
jgi:hypothetical protein